MKVLEHIKHAQKPLFSYEILPPQKGASIKQILDIVEKIRPFNPPWINVTSHASSLVYAENNDGNFKKKIYKKRPGTISVCGLIQNKFGIDAVAHILCQGFSKEETENTLIELNYLGIENIMALKGDNLNYNKDIAKEKSVNKYANELVTQVKDIQNGKFLDDTVYEPLNFSIGVAAYPEKHIEATNLDEDIAYLKQKVDAGADYIVTQMFFDNQKYFNFVAKCRTVGITVPIIPGLKVLKSAKQLQTLPKLFNIDLPIELVDQIKNDPDNAAQIGTKWANNQVHELLEHKVPVIHFFLMNDVDNVIEIIKQYI